MTNEALKEIVVKYDIAEDRISAILTALSIKTEKPNDTQLKGFERVCQLMKEGTSLEEAAQIVTAEAKSKATAKDTRQPSQTLTVAESERQLKEIAVRHAIPDERIPEILAAMKLKLERLTDPQIELFRDVCQMLNSGMSLDIASQSVATKAKAELSTKPSEKKVPDATAINKADAQGEKDVGLVVAAKNEITAPVSQFNESIPGDVREAISQFPREDAQAVVLKSPSIIADAIEVAHDTTEQGLTNFVQQEWFDEYRKGVSDPAFGPQVREILAQGKSQKTSEGSST
jgi:uncharacterized protein YoaH (UPF0181 family)